MKIGFKNDDTNGIVKNIISYLPNIIDKNFILFNCYATIEDCIKIHYNFYILWNKIENTYCMIQISNKTYNINNYVHNINNLENDFILYGSDFISYFFKKKLKYNKSNNLNLLKLYNKNSLFI